MVIVARRRIHFFQVQLLRWYGPNSRKFLWRRRRATRYHRIIAEVLLQRTRRETVATFLPHFLDKYPTWTKIANAPEPSLRLLLQPLGLWRRRAKSLRKLAREMVLRDGKFPKTREEIELLPGVGQYIANAVMLFCHHTPEPLLDVNMARVLERYFGPRKLADIRYDPHLQVISRRVLVDADPVQVNWAILDLAALVCTIQKPRCTECPVARACLYGRRLLGRKT